MDGRSPRRHPAGSPRPTRAVDLAGGPRRLGGERSSRRGERAAAAGALAASPEHAVERAVEEAVGSRPAAREPDGWVLADDGAALAAWVHEPARPPQPRWRDRVRGRTPAPPRSSSCTAGRSRRSSGTGCWPSWCSAAPTSAWCATTSAATVPRRPVDPCRRSVHEPGRSPPSAASETTSPPSSTPAPLRDRSSSSGTRWAGWRCSPRAREYRACWTRGPAGCCS